MSEDERSTPTPLGESQLPDRVSDRTLEEHDLPEVGRGRMLCVVHGRMCYRRISRVGFGEWICPDERHLTPIASS